MLGEPFENKHLFWKKFNFRKFFWTVREKYFVGLLKTFASFPEDNFHEKYHFLWKNNVLFVFMRKLCVFLVETFWQKGQNCISGVPRNRFHFFEACGIFSAIQWKLHSRCLQVHSEEKMFSFLTKSFIFSIWDF